MKSNIDLSKLAGPQKSKSPKPENSAASKAQKDKFLIYFSGTGTVKKSPEQAFEMDKMRAAGVKVMVINGVGTMPDAKASREMRSGPEPQNPGIVTNIVNGVAGAFNGTRDASKSTRDKLLGYDQTTQLVQQNEAIKAISSLDKPTDVVVAGHSRGAAVGVKGFIAELYALSEVAKKEGGDLSNGPFMENIESLHFIPIDPVPGPEVNDKLGAQDLQVEDRVTHMFNAISERAENPDLISTTVINARHDARTPFSLDPEWGKFIENNEGNKCEVHAMGFQHSTMVKTSDPDPTIYPDPDITPKTVAAAIIGNKLGLVDSAEVTQKAEALRERELGIIKNISEDKIGPAEKVVLKQSSRAGYNLVNGLMPYESLQQKTKGVDTTTEPVKINGRTVNQGADFAQPINGDRKLDASKQARLENSASKAKTKEKSKGVKI
jgi:hypothetical protein